MPIAVTLPVGRQAHESRIPTGIFSDTVAAAGILRADARAQATASRTGVVCGIASGEAKQIGGTVLAVWKKLPDGNWNGFRAMRV